MNSVLHKAPTESRPAARTDWATAYASRLLVTDVVVIVWAVFGSQLAWFGLAQSTVTISGHFRNFALSYTSVSVVLSGAWIIFLSVAGSRDRRVVGAGTAEYQRIISSSLMLFGLMAIASYLLKAELARGYFVTALPIGLAALLVSRWMWRQYLSVKRSDGGFSSRVVLVGSAASALMIGRELRRSPGAGYHVVGAYVPHGSTASFENTDIPILGAVGDVVGGLDETLADTIIVTSSDELPPEQMRRLSWSLEPGRQHLVVAPGLIDIAGPRIHTRPVAGLPLVHVETPRYEGSRSFAKRAFDVALSGLLLFVSSPIMLTLAAIVKISSPGPVLYRSQRIGYRGEPFEMLKFRTMRLGADAELQALLAAQGTASKPLFKIENDPRITGVGRILRQYSLDELPQILNVFLGTMSLVGPRPQIAAEVALYDSAAERRLLLKPGVSGLWQVSGRSNLDWEDAIRLDLYYVENWSLAGDISILMRTVRAVVARDGAA